MPKGQARRLSEAEWPTQLPALLAAQPAEATLWLLLWDAAQIQLRPLQEEERQQPQSLLTQLAGKEARIFGPRWELRLRPISAQQHAAWLYEESEQEGDFEVRETKLLLWGSARRFPDGAVRLLEVQVRGAQTAELLPDTPETAYYLAAKHYCDPQTGQVLLTRYCEMRPYGSRESDG